MNLIPRLLLCILDRVEVLEDLSNADYTQNLAGFLEAFCRMIEHSYGNCSGFNLCMLSDGYVDAISILLQRGDFISVTYDADAEERAVVDTLEMDYSDMSERD